MTKKKQKVDSKVIIAGIAGLVILECVALFNGINGTLYTLVIAAVAGLAGWTIPMPIRK